MGAPLVTKVHNSFDEHSVIIRLGRVVIAVSDAKRKLLLVQGYHARKVVTVRNRSDSSPRKTLTDASLGILTTSCVVTLPGLHQRKAVDDVIKAFAQVVPEFQHWHLNIIGGSSDRNRCAAMNANFGMDDLVRLKGSTLAPRSLLNSAGIYAPAVPPLCHRGKGGGLRLRGHCRRRMPKLPEHGVAGLLTSPSGPRLTARAFRTLLANQDVLTVGHARARRGTRYFTVQRMAWNSTCVSRRRADRPDQLSSRSDTQGSTLSDRLQPTTSGVRVSW